METGYKGSRARGTTAADGRDHRARARDPSSSAADGHAGPRPRQLLHPRRLEGGGPRRSRPPRSPAVPVAEVGPQAGRGPPEGRAHRRHHSQPPRPLRGGGPPPRRGRCRGGDAPELPAVVGPLRRGPRLRRAGGSQRRERRRARRGGGRAVLAGGARRADALGRRALQVPVEEEDLLRGHAPRLGWPVLQHAPAVPAGRGRGGAPPRRPRVRRDPHAGPHRRPPVPARSRQRDDDLRRPHPAVDHPPHLRSRPCHRSADVVLRLARQVGRVARGVARPPCARAALHRPQRPGPGDPHPPRGAPRHPPRRLRRPSARHRGRLHAPALQGAGVGSHGRVARRSPTSSTSAGSATSTSAGATTTCSSTSSADRPGARAPRPLLPSCHRSGGRARGPDDRKAPDATGVCWQATRMGRLE